jgi:hypothetical protein
MYCHYFGENMLQIVTLAPGINGAAFGIARFFLAQHTKTGKIIPMTGNYAKLP